LFACSCAASLKSAATVGAQGKKLADLTPAADTALLCDYARALISVKQEKCDEWTAGGANRRAALNSLAHYGEALKAIAEMKDPDTEPASEAMVAAVTAVQDIKELKLPAIDTTKYEGALAGLINFITKAQRSAVVAKVVKDADASIQELVQLLSK
jgi:hypothetical protein